MKKDVAIVFGITSDYIFALANVLIGLKKHNKVFWDDIIVYHDGIPDANKQILNEILPCTFVKYSKELLKNDIDKLPSTREYSLLALSRFECFELLKEYSKVMWHDVDILIQDDITDLLTYADKTGYAATKSDSFRVEQNFYEIIPGYNMLSLLYNSGILVLSDKLLELGDLRTYCYTKYNQYAEKIRYSDQAVLNMFIQDFHISVEEISLSKFCCHPSNKDYRHAKIIHAYGKDKFWNSDKLKRQFPEWVENNNLWENKRNHSIIRSSSKPLVTVLMSIYMRTDYMKTAIDSILNQTYDNLELIIVVEASNNQSRIKDEIASIHDERIVVICNQSRLGFAESLNVGLRAAKGKYIARMDDDDVSLPERIDKEVAYLEEHPEVDIVGGWIKFFGRANHEEHRPENNDELNAWAIKESPFFHPTVMIRKDTMDKNGFLYDPQWFTEDYDLWLRILPKVHAHNLQEVLLLYRASGENATATQADKVMNSHLDLMRRNLRERLGLEFTRDQMRLLRTPQIIYECYHADEMKQIREEVITEIYAANRKKKVYDPQILKLYLGEMHCDKKSLIKHFLKRFPLLYSVIRRLYKMVSNSNNRELPKRSLITRLKMRLLPPSSKSFHEKTDTIEFILNEHSKELLNMKQRLEWTDGVVRRAFQASNAAFWGIYQNGNYPDPVLNEFNRFKDYEKYIASLYIFNYLKCKLKIESLCILNNTGDEWEKAARNLGISIVTTNKNDVKTINRYDGVVITEQLGTIESKRNFDFSSNIIITYIECSSPLEAETRLAIKSQMKYMIDCYDENGYVGIPLYDTLKDIWEIKEQYIYSLIVFVKRDSLDADGEVYEGLSNNTRKDLN